MIDIVRMVYYDYAGCIYMMVCYIYYDLLCGYYVVMWLCGYYCLYLYVGVFYGSATGGICPDNHLMHVGV